MQQTWYPDETPGVERRERYCPNERCDLYTMQMTVGTHCEACDWYFIPGTHPNPVNEPSVYER